MALIVAEALGFELSKVHLPPSGFRNAMKELFPQTSFTSALGSAGPDMVFMDSTVIEGGPIGRCKPETTLDNRQIHEHQIWGGSTRGQRKGGTWEQLFYSVVKGQRRDMYI